jgi:hypothetical protein
MQVTLDGWLSVAAVGGDRAGHPARAPGDPFHGGHQLRAVRGSAVFHGVVQNDSVVVAGDLGLVPELHRAVDASLADRPCIRVCWPHFPTGV